MEAVLSGTTTLVDHHASPGVIDGSLDLIEDAFAEIGVRSVLAYETSDRDGPGHARAGIQENRRFLARVAATSPQLVRGLVGAHASFTLSDETLEACVDLAVSSGRGLHIHVAEDTEDERDAEARHGLRVLDRLERAGGMAPAPVLAHGVHLDHAEAALFRASGATLVHNPRSNMNNAVGRAPLGMLGSRVALGTDGIGADMFEEGRTGYLRLAEERGSRGRGDTGRGDDLLLDDAGAVDASWPLQRLAAGARLVGDAFDEPGFGRIVPGAPADLVVLDQPLPTPITADTLAGHWVFGLSARAVRDVLVAGRVVVREGRLTGGRRGGPGRRGPGPGRPPVGAPRCDRGASVRARGGDGGMTRSSARPRTQPMATTAPDPAAAVDLGVEVCGIRFPNPVWTAAGPPVRDGAALLACAEGGAGGLVTKTISRTAAEPTTPNMAEISHGFLNAELWSELPPERWIEREYAITREAGLPVVVSMGYTAEDIAELAPRVRPFADALELSTHYIGEDAGPMTPPSRRPRRLWTCPSS